MKPLRSTRGRGRSSTRSPPATLWRATAYLYNSETRSSYAIERETPKAGRVERFVSALREAWEAPQMSRELLARVQNAIAEPAYAERAERTAQNRVSRIGPGFEEEVLLLPPTPEASAERLRGAPRMPEEGGAVEGASAPEALDLRA